MRVSNEGIVIDADLPPPDEDGRKAARERSAKCPHCGGEGLAIVDATDPDSRVRSCGATCVCVHGRWIRAWHVTKGSRRILDRLPDLRAVMEGHDPNWRYDDGDDRGADAPPGPITRAQIARLFRPAGGAA